MTASSLTSGTVHQATPAFRPMQAASIGLALRRFVMVLIGVTAIAVAVPLAIATQQDGQMFVD